MTLALGDHAGPWSNHTVTTLNSGRTYRVALRGWERGQSYCSCPDFRKNTLGTCKHILFGLEEIRNHYPAEVLNQPYVRRGISVVLRYSERIELRMLLPDGLPPAVEAIVRPFRDCPIEDVHGLVLAIRRLEGQGMSVTLYPDAEEHIDQRLLGERIARRVGASGSPQPEVNCSAPLFSFWPRSFRRLRTPSRAGKWRKLCAPG